MPEISSRNLGNNSVVVNKVKRLNKISLIVYNTQ